MGQQLAEQNKALESSTYQGITDKLLELDNIFIEDPKIRPYIFEGKILSRDENKKNIDKELLEKDKQEKKEKIADLHNKISAISDYQLDFFEMVWDQSDYIKELREGQADWKSWERYIKYSFEKNPMLCKHFQDVKNTYGDSFVEFIEKDMKNEYNICASK